MAIRDITAALLLSIFFAFPTALIFSFAPNYSQALLVPNAPLEEYRNLSHEEQQKLIKSENGLRPITGFSKVTYLLSATPETYLLKSSIMFFPLFIVSIISAIMARRSEKT